MAINDRSWSFLVFQGDIDGGFIDNHRGRALQIGLRLYSWGESSGSWPREEDAGWDSESRAQATLRGQGRSTWYTHTQSFVTPWLGHSGSVSPGDCIVTQETWITTVWPTLGRRVGECRRITSGCLAWPQGHFIKRSSLGEMDVTTESMRTLRGALRLPRDAVLGVCTSPQGPADWRCPGPSPGSFLSLPLTSILVWLQSCVVQLWTRPAVVPRALPFLHRFSIFIWKGLHVDSLVGRGRGKKEGG